MNTSGDARKTPLATAIVAAAMAVFIVYGGSLLWIAMRAGTPDLELFDKYSVDVPAITEMSMDTPRLFWLATYVLLAAVLIWQSSRPTISKKMCFLNMILAAVGLLVMYIAYLGLAVLPGAKLMMHFAQ